jgi:dihydropteroate synthase type 2
MRKPEIVGVVNITADSFSDGGTYLEPHAAIKHANKLLADGADILDLGAAASNPHAQSVSAQEEIERLAPVVAHLQKKGARISIDSTKREVQQWALEQEVEFLNDIRGFPDPTFYPELARSKAKLVVMHFISELDKAVRQPKAPHEVLESIKHFFTERLAMLRAGGIKDEQLILDPGMGFFLASNPEPSFAVLSSLSELHTLFDLPIYVGISRKSFLRNIGDIDRCDIGVRTLTAELHAANCGIAYIRTHDVHALHEGLLVRDALSAMVESAHYH